MTRDQRPDAELGQTFARWAREGRAEHLAAVFEATAPGLLRLARHFVRGAADAEDLLQSTFVTAMQKAAHFEPDRPLLPWLNGILRHHAQELRARDRRQLDVDQVPDPTTHPDPTQTAQQRELDAEVQRAIDRMAASDRALLLLHLRHGLAPAEIAEVLNRSPGTVRVQLHRARERMRRLLPASIGSALALHSGLRAERGLLQIERDLLAMAAARTGPATAISLGALQVLSMHLTTKIGLAAAALLTITGAWLLTRPPANEQPLPAGAQPTGEQHVHASPDDSRAQPTVARQPAPLASDDDDASTSPSPSLELTAMRLDDGRPLAGIALLVEPADGRHPSLHRRAVTTDEFGRATLHDLAAGTYRVVADRGSAGSGGDAKAGPPGEPGAELHAITSRTLPLVAVPPHDRVRGYSFHNPHVIARNEGPDSERLRIRGRVELAESAAELLVVEDDASRPAVVPMPRFEVDEPAAVHAHHVAARFELADRTVTLQLRLPTGRPVTGRVVDRDGAAVAGASLGVLAAGDSEPRTLGVRSDESGRFACEDVMPDSSLYAFGVEGMACSVPVEVRGEADEGELVLRLQRAAGSIAGVVRDPHGRPLPDAQVRLGRLHPRDVVTRLRTDADGRFGPVWLADHEVTALVQTPGFAPWVARVRVAGRRDLDVQLERGWTLRGHLLEASGEPVADARITAATSQRTTTFAVTDEVGRFALECLPVGAIELRVGGDLRGRSLRETVQGRAGEQQQRELRRPPAGRIDLRFVDPQGEPLADWIASIVPLRADATAARVTDRIGADGRVSLPTWPDERYRLELQPGCREVLEVTLRDGSIERFACYQGPPVISTATPILDGRSLGIETLAGVTEERTIRVPFHLLPNARLRGRLVDDDGRPLQGWVSVEGEGFTGWLEHADASGRFAIEPLLPGEYVFRAKPRGAERFELDVKELSPGQDLDLGDVRAPR